MIFFSKPACACSLFSEGTTWSKWWIPVIRICLRIATRIFMHNFISYVFYLSFVQPYMKNFRILRWNIKTASGVVLQTWKMFAILSFDRMFLLVLSLPQGLQAWQLRLVQRLRLANVPSVYSLDSGNTYFKSEFSVIVPAT